MQALSCRTVEHVVKYRTGGLNKILDDHTNCKIWGKSFSCIFQMLLCTCYGLWHVHQCIVPLIAHKKASTLFRRITWQLEKTLHSILTPGQVVVVSSKTVAINCPLMKRLCFPRSCQMLSVRPCLPIASLYALVSSSQPSSQLPITFCPRLSQSNEGVSPQPYSRPSSSYWLFSLDHSVPSRPPHTYIVMEGVFRSFH